MDDFLGVFPVKICEYEINNGLITVNFLNEKKSFLDKLLKNKGPRIVKIDLDEIGSFIYPLCNGNNSVDDIIKTSRKHFDESIEPAQERIPLFIKQLNENKLVKLYKKSGTDN